MDDFDRFKALFKKFVNGLRWNAEKHSKGLLTEKDRADFQNDVVNPMDEMWSAFSDEDKEYWFKVMHAVHVFNGTIV